MEHYFTFSADQIVKRLRWVMVGVILFNLFNGLVGQPGSYWHHAETADETNHLFRYFMVQGLPIYLSFQLVYVLAAFLFVSIACKRAALIGIFAFILGHFAGACTWLCNHWHFGVEGSVIYAAILGYVIVASVVPMSARIGHIKGDVN